MRDTLLVIPARYASTRFPAKVLAKLGGKPIVQWVYEACKKADLGDVLIATEHEAVVKAAAQFGASAIMTSEACASGTDRVFEASKGRKEQFVVNVQSDEPFLQTETLVKAIELLRSNPDADIATAGAPITAPEEVNDPNCVKIALCANGRCLYFSRSQIPFHHPLSDSKNAPWHKHCGLYAYRRASLERFVKLPPSAMEKLERLEQLRALEDGMKIYSVTVPLLGPAIDTPADLEEAEKFLARMQGK